MLQQTADELKMMNRLHSQYKKLQQNSNQAVCTIQAMEKTCTKKSVILSFFSFVFCCFLFFHPDLMSNDGCYWSWRHFVEGQAAGLRHPFYDAPPTQRHQYVCPGLILWLEIIKQRIVFESIDRMISWLPPRIRVQGLMSGCIQCAWKVFTALCWQIIIILKTEITFYPKVKRCEYFPDALIQSASLFHILLWIWMKTIQCVT